LYEILGKIDSKKKWIGRIGKNEKQKMNRANTA
jgi:hypothetical protein